MGFCVVDVVIGVGFLCFRFRALLACLAVFFFVDFQFDQYFLLVFSEYPLICSDDLLVRHEGLLVCLDDRHFRSEFVCLGDLVDEESHNQRREEIGAEEVIEILGFPPREGALGLGGGHLV